MVTRKKISLSADPISRDVRLLSHLIRNVKTVVLQSVSELTEDSRHVIRVNLSISGGILHNTREIEPRLHGKKHFRSMWSGIIELPDRSTWTQTRTYSCQSQQRAEGYHPSTRAITQYVVITAVMFIVISIFTLIANAMIRAR